MPSGPSYRLFFALWPSAALRGRIADAVRPQAESSGGRAVAPSNIHITLAFLGQVSASYMQQALGAGAATRARPFELHLDRIESWPEAQVLCLTPTEVPPGLSALADSLRFNLSQRQFRLRRQRFRPHVTLARNLPGHRPPSALAPVHWRVEDFVLVRSEPAPGGSKYFALARWPLQGVDTAQ